MAPDGHALAATQDRGPNGGGAAPVSPDDPVDVGLTAKDPAVFLHSSGFGHPHDASQRTRPRSLIRGSSPWSGPRAAAAASNA